jgi:hypothetical protein
MGHSPGRKKKNPPWGNGLDHHDQNRAGKAEETLEATSAFEQSTKPISNRQQNLATAGFINLCLWLLGSAPESLPE